MWALRDSNVKPDSHMESVKSAMPNPDQNYKNFWLSKNLVTFIVLTTISVFNSGGKIVRVVTALNCRTTSAFGSVSVSAFERRLTLKLKNHIRKIKKLTRESKKLSWIRLWSPDIFQLEPSRWRPFCMVLGDRWEPFCDLKVFKVIRMNNLNQNSGTHSGKL